MIQLSGYVKIHRKLLQWGWYSDCVVKDVFLHLLIVAAFKDGEFLGHHIKAGQAVISSQKIADELGFTRQQVRTALKKLESTKEITQKSTNKFTIVTVENWEDYQLQENFLTINQPTSNQQVTNKQPTDNQQVTTSKECKERKNVKKERMKEIYKEIPTELHEPLDAYIEMRKLKKKPLNTDRAITMLLKKLNELSNGNIQTSIDILDQSTTNCWTGIFPLKEKDKTKTDSVSFLDL